MSKTRRVAAAILAAGSSSRLGRPKQLVQLRREALLERAVRLAVEAGCDPVLVVLGANARMIEAGCDLSRAQVLHNAEWTEGIASSIRCAISALPFDAEALVLMACDQPAVTVGHLQALYTAAEREVTASAYGGRHGVPACFPADAFNDLLLLQGDTGARALLQTAHAVDLPGGELDVDTPEALTEMLRLYRES